MIKTVSGYYAKNGKKIFSNRCSVPPTAVSHACRQAGNRMILSDY